MREFKAVVLGAGGVGKSALAVRFVRNEFVEVYDPTIEEAYRRAFEVDGEMSMIEVLDTAGADQFTALKEMYIQHGQGFVLVFSLTQESTLREVESLRQQIYRIKGENSNFPLVLVGTKLDLASEREIPTSTLDELSSRWGGVPIFETSAKRNWHVQDVFAELVRQMRQRIPFEPEIKKRRRRLRGTCIIM
ncbi:small GTPase superfamily [Vararia minispora EC-137]|uniref:Small GTPase superfamily n=1 Tax=Vararia minispora EC-137 TaxID=1314806 RepID=A0ACB8QUI1_9AGAM|nr:small GTPase superfamily [Vararia minispora EC-137]